MTAPTAHGTQVGDVFVVAGVIVAGCLVAYGDGLAATWLAIKDVLILAPSITFS